MKTHKRKEGDGGNCARDPRGKANERRGPTPEAWSARSEESCQ